MSSIKSFNLDDILSEVKNKIATPEVDMDLETKAEVVEETTEITTKSEESKDQFDLDGPNKDLFNAIKDKFNIPTNFMFKDKNTFYQMIRNIMRKEWILVTGPTGCGKTHLGKILADAMDMNFFSINLGDTSNPASKLLGHIAYDPEKGTHFVRSKFVEMIQSKEPTLIMLDEITRDRSQELQNILIPVLDEQKMLILDEERPPETIKVSDNVFFFATANVGRQYIGASNTIDRAWLDRFTGGYYQIDYLERENETQLIQDRTQIDSELAEKITLFAQKVRALADADELSTSVSTRMTLSAATAVGDGVDILEALINVATPYFDEESEKAKVLQIIEAM